jgi:hypothetical protein
MTDGELGWVAGWLEGEGNFGVVERRYPRISACSQDEDVVRKALALTGAGSITGPYRAASRDGFARQPQWWWRVSKSSDVVGLLRVLRPRMHARRQREIDRAL